MRKSTRIVKRLFALFLVVLMSINTLGAVVSDNDGSAYGKWVAKRPTATPFECFRYNVDTSRLIAYSNDLKVKFTTIRNNNSFASWSRHATSDTSNIWGIHWHCCAYPEGLPIGLFKEDDECEFELNLPYAMSVGFRTNVFTAGTVVLNTSNDANLEVTIDNVKKTNSNNELTAGNHKIKFKYVGSGSRPIFIKIGRANADLSTTYRYIVTLPIEYTKTAT